MDWITQILAAVKDPTTHKIIAGVIVLYVFLAVADAWTPPPADAPLVVRFTWRFVQALAGNFKKAGKALHVPGMEA